MVPVHLAESRVESMAPEIFVDAVHSFFLNERRATIAKRRQAMRQGRAALMIGMAFLGACTILAKWAAAYDLGVLALPVKEGLTILGWVAMWRPIDLLLYSWWPLIDYVHLYGRLSQLAVDVRYDSTTVRHLPPRAE